MLLIEKLINPRVIDVNIATRRAKDFYNKNSIEEAIFIISLIYIQRFYSKDKISSRNLDEVIRSCLSLANKFLLDCEIKTSTKMETDVITKLNWNLFVSKEEYYITHRRFLE